MKRKIEDHVHYTTEQNQRDIKKQLAEALLEDQHQERETIDRNRTLLLNT